MKYEARRELMWNIRPEENLYERRGQKRTNVEYQTERGPVMNIRPKENLPVCEKSGQ